MVNFLDKSEEKISKEFLQDGYIIKKIDDLSSLNWIKKTFSKILQTKKNFKNVSQDQAFDETHNHLNKKDLNEFRLDMINKLNLKKELRKKYFNCAKKYLDLIVGNELVMQKRINLSIQFPNDSSSLLDVHADVWSGDSPYEAVVWIPMVDCYKTKSMYILPFSKYKKYEGKLFDKKIKNSENLYKKIKKDLKWLNVKYGELIIFNQCLPHGNVVNKTNETRWSMNCRFKSVYSPYADKKIGEFFEPISLKAASKAAMKYNFPKLS
ncbi:2OG-Fe(II) oxygenase [Candidatus Pelagibacter bacterium]|nr:sporadic carbohydrate cluster 2OG-Fe(II) oxygenase [Candidatus Pelagibacter bacterium]MDA9625053.1 2OG-Fe(II) oxygenase [Candidatus Pelagibacter bacterium]